MAVSRIRWTTIAKNRAKARRSEESAR